MGHFLLNMNIFRYLCNRNSSEDLTLMEQIGKQALQTKLGLTIMKNRTLFRRSNADLYERRGLFKYFIAVILLFLSMGSLFYTNYLVDKLEEREEREVKIYTEGLRYAINSQPDENFNVVMEMLQEAVNFYQIPAIYVDQNGFPQDVKNIDFPKNVTQKEREAIISESIAKMKEDHPPIPVEIAGLGHGYIYYTNSFLLTQLRLYPFISLFVMLFIGYLAYLAFSSARKAEQNRVWVGLAKETAHQLGTPLSSLIAWVEYFRSDPAIESSIADEIEKDVIRLEMITARFSNIGSIPTMKEELISDIIKKFIAYLEKRISSKVLIEISDELVDGQMVLMNKNLFEWVIENICKNAVDAMGGVGEINIILQSPPLTREIRIDITDTGKGMSKKQMSRIFDPGFSTKKRGWGLGLTLAKRIIENYHSGKLFVKNSEIGKGTTFRIILNAQPILSEEV